MSDIVERLQSVDASWSDVGETCAEAAETILALRKAIKEAEIHIDCASFRKAQDVLRAALSTTEAK